MTLGLANVVAIAGDPGGAAAIAPVIAALRETGSRVHALAYRQAGQVWQRRAVVYQQADEAMTTADATTVLDQCRANVLLAATSVNGIDLEKRFLSASRSLDLPSLAVLDFWSNYRLRFADEADELAYLPDAIAVMDQRARLEMVAAGFDPARLLVTGQPAFDELQQCRARLTPQRRSSVRSRLGVRPDERMVLFASQPLSALYGTDRSNPLFPGYTEQTVLDGLVEALAHLAQRRRTPIALAVRPHPREKAEALQRHGRAGLRLCVDDSNEGREVALAAELVAGMTTVLLVESCLMGCVTISLQPGLRLPDPLPSNRWGASVPVYQAEEIEPVVERLLFDEQERARATAAAVRSPVISGATQRVRQLAEALARRQALVYREV